MQCAVKRPHSPGLSLPCRPQKARASILPTGTHIWKHKTVFHRSVLLHKIPQSLQPETVLVLAHCPKQAVYTMVKKKSTPPLSLTTTMTTTMAVALVLLLAGPTDGEMQYLNQWAAEIEGGLDQALRIAERHGFELVEQVSYLDNHYILAHGDVSARSKRSADHHTTRLADESGVKWAEQQVVRDRVKRGYHQHDHGESEEISCPGGCPFNDPMLGHEWYITGDNTNRTYMTELLEVWKKYSGKGIVVTVVDDGLEHNNTDIEPNYDPDASFDFNQNDTDPMPRYEITNENKHGTRCAGEIAMVANNSFCGAGVAYNVGIGGIKLLDGPVTDHLESASLCFNFNHIDIYSLSWGPTDDGKTLDKPHKLASNCMDNTIKQGRSGKGVIYVLASGNGGSVMDNCNCDGYAASMYTISVSSANQRGFKPWFGELCASTLTTTYSSGSHNDKAVVTTDLHNGCTEHHSGTSASAPLAAGIIALTLEANSSLTWRDVQHLVVISSKPDQLLVNKGWYMNAANHCVNLAFGFGLLDAMEMVTRAEKWQTLPERVTCRSDSKATRALLPRELKSGGVVNITIRTDGCNDTENEINYLEHVQFIITVNYTSRGAISAIATSPSGTKTELLGARRLDNATQNFTNWPLMSVHTWGENPAGEWNFRLEDKGIQGHNNSGELLLVEMILYGTKDPPFYREDNTTRCTINFTEYESSFNKSEKKPLSSTEDNDDNSEDDVKNVQDKHVTGENHEYGFSDFANGVMSQINRLFSR